MSIIINLDGGDVLILKRDIYKKLVDWKMKNTNKVLELEGARQVGKTYILDQFKEEYSNHIYINMIGASGREFLKCIEAAEKWKPGDKRIEKPMIKAFELFEPEFKDSKDCLIVIDEIQDSPEVYSRIREFARDFQSQFIVTGSYLGKTIEKEFFHSAGDVVTLKMETLSFPEFLDAFGKREIYEDLDLYGSSRHVLYDDIRNYFNIYLKIGGYPEVVTTYVDTKDIALCMIKLEELTNIFIKESLKYFDTAVELGMFEKVLTSIAVMMLKDKKGTKDLVTDLSKIIFKEESGRVTKKVIHSVISWLYLSHQIGYCDKSIDCNHLDIIANCRYYFADLGIGNSFLTKTGETRESIEGCLCENFAYQELVRRIRRHEIAGNVPYFGTDERTDGELDFYVRSLLDYKNYGIEVKRGDEGTKTADTLLKSGRLDYIYNMKRTYGGIKDEKHTVPLFLIGRIKFDLGI